MSKKQQNELARANVLDYLYDLYQKKGVKLNKKQLKALEDSGYIQKERIPVKAPGKSPNPEFNESVKSELSVQQDKYIDVIDNYGGEIDSSNDIVIEADEYNSEEFLKRFQYSGGKDITVASWMPRSVTEHTNEFYRWINSINAGFQSMEPYIKFQMYCQQSSDWIAQNDNINNYETIQEKKEYIWREFERCQQNTLYFADKYCLIKEADLNGDVSYIGKPVHKVMFYLFDCGYSFMMGKPRQIAATTTLGICATKKTIFTKNFFIKMIAQDREKVIEIYDDKIRFPMGELPDWMQPSVLNDRDNFLRLGSKKGKGKSKGINSKLQVVAPSVSAINGGAPNLVLIDEAGYIGIIGKMMREARPTLFVYNPQTKKLEMKRQIIVWGTGGEMDKAGKAYQDEYQALIDSWNKHDFSKGMIPIFFDWTTRPGMTKEQYESEKKAYLNDNADKEEALVQFRQAYPSIIEDMFLSSAKTIVSAGFINQNLERIRSNDKAGCDWGYLEPIFDYDRKADEADDVHYKVIGANFVHLEKGDPNASVQIFMRPKQNWVNRYYQGTDPVMNDNGYSNMASAIWDNHYKTPAAIMNYRESNTKNVFLQTMLLGLYYDVESRHRAVRGVKELIESNIGKSYQDYKDSKGYYNSLVYMTELPHAFQGGGSVIGIDNRAIRNKFIINKIHELLMAYGHRIWIPVIYEQLRTFVCSLTEAGNETWGVANKKKYHDDVLFAVVYSYICSLSYESLTPKELKSEQDHYKIEYKLVRGRDGMLTRSPVKTKIHG